MSNDTDHLYRNSGKLTLNSDAEFWHAIALGLSERYAHREQQACRFAQKARQLSHLLRLVQRTAAEYRAQIDALEMHLMDLDEQLESLKRETENRDYAAEIYRAQIESMKNE